MKRCLFTLFFLTFSTAALSTEVTIYRWVDDNNIVHFSQNQPVTADYTQLSTTKMIVKKPYTTPTNKKDISNKDDDNSEENVDKSVKENEKDKCFAARKNLKTLQDFDNIKYKTATGDFKVLSVKEKKAQLAFNKTQIELYCTN